MDLEASDEVRRLLATFQKFAKAEWSKHSILGIKPSEIRVLLCIKDISKEGKQRVTVSEISKKLFITSPSVTQIIKSLSTIGYIERSVDTKDRRIADIKLTNTGEQIVQKAREFIITNYSGLLEALGKEKSETLITLLDQVYVYFEARLKEHQNEN
jgi:DNA-binding MarR family transcriptional regulator